METLKKLVMRMMMLGARESTVSSKRSWSEKATSRPVPGFLMVRSMKGITGSSGGSGMVMVPWVERPGKGGGVWASAPMGEKRKKKTAAITPRLNRLKGLFI
jgi:hypothetical protein